MEKINIIQEFFADIVLGIGNWRTAINLDNEKVIATSDSVFSDTWTIINEEEAIKGLKILQDELENSTLFLKEINAIKDADRFAKRQTIINSLEYAVNEVEPELFNIDN